MVISLEEILKDPHAHANAEVVAYLANQLSERGLSDKIKNALPDGRSVRFFFDQAIAGTDIVASLNASLVSVARGDVDSLTISGAVDGICFMRAPTLTRQLPAKVLVEPTTQEEMDSALAAKRDWHDAGLDGDELNSPISAVMAETAKSSIHLNPFGGATAESVRLLQAALDRGEDIRSPEVYARAGFTNIQFSDVRNRPSHPLDPLFEMSPDVNSEQALGRIKTGIEGQMFAPSTDFSGSEIGLDEVVPHLIKDVVDLNDLEGVAVYWPTDEETGKLSFEKSLEDVHGSLAGAEELDEVVLNHDLRYYTTLRIFAKPEQAIVLSPLAQRLIDLYCGSQVTPNGESNALNYNINAWHGEKPNADVAQIVMDHFKIEHDPSEPYKLSWALDHAYAVLGGSKGMWVAARKELFEEDDEGKWNEVGGVTISMLISILVEDPDSNIDGLAVDCGWVGDEGTVGPVGGDGYYQSTRFTMYVRSGEADYLGEIVDGHLSRKDFSSAGTSIYSHFTQLLNGIQDEDSRMLVGRFIRDMFFSGEFGHDAAAAKVYKHQTT